MTYRGERTFRARRAFLRMAAGMAGWVGLGGWLGGALAQSNSNGSNSNSSASNDNGEDGDQEAAEAVNPGMEIPGATPAPRTSIDLTRWKLTLPVNEDGQATARGDAEEVYQLAGFQLPPYYSVTASSISFAAPTNGARTGGSKYPRCELREMDGEGDEFEWTIANRGRLSASLRVNEVPTTDGGTPGRLVIGQIHGPSDELCRLYYDNRNVYFVDDKAGPSRKETTFQLVSSSGKKPDIPMRSRFSYLIDANAERLLVQVKHGGTTYSATDPISTFWPNKKLYFKAGVYVQVGARGSGAGQIGTGTGGVTFYSISPPGHG